MNIHRLIIIAGAKDKIAKYKITDPHLIYFLYSYDPIIPWKDIKSVEDINATIKNVLLPKLYEKMDRKGKENNYLKDINLELEFQVHMNDPNVQKAYEIYKQNPETSKQIILDGVNSEKEQSFRAWQNYLNTQPKYANSPAFSYCLLKKMLDVSPETQKNGTYSVQPTVVSFLYDAVAKNPKSQINLLPVYQKRLADIQASGLEDYDPDKKSGWKRIPSKISEPDKFDENVKTLKDLSLPQGWCTGSFNAEPYLSKGDHWLYLVDGVAKVTIRLNNFDDKTNQQLPVQGMAEIRGPHNTVPEPWAEEILNFVYKKNFQANWSYNDHVKELESSCDFLNKKFENGEISPEDINFGQYQRLSSTNRAKLSEQNKERIAREWAATPGAITITSEIPPEFKHYPFIREQYLNVWKIEIRAKPEIYDGPNMPADLKEIPEIKQIRLDAWYERIGKNMDLYETAPADIIADPKVHDKIIDHCIRKVEEDPAFYNQLPLGIRRGDDRILKILNTKIIPTIANKIVEDPTVYEDVAYEFVGEPILEDAFKEGLIELIRRKPQAFGSRVCTSSLSNHAADLEEKLKKSPTTKAELKKAWLEGIQAQQTKKPLPPRDKKTFMPQEEPAPEPLPIPQPEEKPVVLPQKNDDINASLNWYERTTVKYAEMKLQK